MIRINLIPVPKVRKQEKLIIEAAVALAAIVVVVVACYLYSSGKQATLDALAKENKKIERQIAQLKAKVGEVEKYKQKLKTLRDQLAVINSLEAGRTGPVRMMDELTDLIPRKVWVTSFREKGRKVTIQGFGDDGQTIADFLEALKASKHFSGVDLSTVQSASQDSQDVHRFTINLNVKYDL